MDALLEGTRVRFSRNLLRSPSKGTIKVLSRFATVLVFLALSVGFAVITLAISWALRPRVRSRKDEMAYECGEVPEGSPWVRFNVRFYLVALFFIVFDVEVVFLLPWAVVFKDMLAQMGSFVFWEMVLFVAILLVGLAYVWAKGDLAWVKSLAPRDEDEVESLSWYSSGQYPADAHSAHKSAKPEGV